MSEAYKNTVMSESGYGRANLDAYFTEAWVTVWLMKAGFMRPKLNGWRTWEPACGKGHMSSVLGKFNHLVHSTDVFDHGYDKLDGLCDFMKVTRAPKDVDLIITNPPYEIKDHPTASDVTAEQFVRHAIALMKPVKGKVIMLLRNEFDAAETRKDMFRDGPFAGKFVLTKRPSWISKRVQSASAKGNSGPRHNYAWFYWDWASKPGNARIVYLPVVKPRAYL